MIRKPYPIIFSMFPVLFLWGNLSKEEIVIWHTIIPSILFSLAIALSVWGTMKFLVWNNANKRAFLASFLTMFILAYGHVHTIAYSITPTVGRHRNIIPFFILSYAFMFYLVKNSSRSFQSVTNVLNYASFFLLIIPIWNIAYYSQSLIPYNYETRGSPNVGAVSNVPNIEKRDIYYFILDGYAGQNTLSNIYEFNNDKFINNLKEKGFYVADDSHSNYRTTPLSIASSLNYDYLDNLDEYYSDITNDELDEGVAGGLLALGANSRIQSFLKRQGYYVLNFNSGKGATGWGGSAAQWDENIHCSEVSSQLHMVFYNTTIFGSFDLDLKFDELKLDYYLRNNERARILCPLDNIVYAKKYSSKPMFVLAHIIAPHPPFVFGPNGEEVNDRALSLTGQAVWNDREGYLNQLQFINRRIAQVVDTLLEQSRVKPIIVIQADHGPASLEDIDSPTLLSLSERMGILNAYYFPDENWDDLYPSITPVNSFRVILNNYFDQNLPYLPDRVYYQQANSFSDLALIDVTNILRPSNPPSDTNTSVVDF